MALRTLLPHPRRRCRRRPLRTLTARQQRGRGHARPGRTSTSASGGRRRSVGAGPRRARGAPRSRGGAARLHPYTGAIRVLDAPGWSGARRLARTPAEPAAAGRDRLGLDDEDLDGLTVVRDYVSRSTGCATSRSPSRSTACRCSTPPSPSTSRRTAKSCSRHVERGARERPRREATVAAEDGRQHRRRRRRPGCAVAPVRVGGAPDARPRDSSAAGSAATSRPPSCGLPWTAAPGSPGTSSRARRRRRWRTTSSSTPQRRAPAAAQPRARRRGQRPSRAVGRDAGADPRRPDADAGRRRRLPRR